MWAVLSFALLAAAAVPSMPQNYCWIRYFDILMAFVGGMCATIAVLLAYAP